MTAVSIIIPWFLPLAAPGKVILVGLAVALGAGAFLWNKRAVKIAGTMDIIAAGHDGEGAVAKILARLPRDWAVLNNLALRVNGPIVQIDHMVITPVAVHILETKSQKGQIIAAPDSGKWQVKRRGETRSIVNPVQQNRRQVRACRELLAKLGSNLPCHGLVVMTEAMTQTDWPITRATELARYLDRSPVQGVVQDSTLHNLVETLLERLQLSDNCLSSGDFQMAVALALKFCLQGWDALAGAGGEDTEEVADPSLFFGFEADFGAGIGDGPL